VSPIVSSHLSFGWPDDTPLFVDLSFTIPGGRTGLVAPNGAGKSALLKLIVGEFRPAAGGVVVDGTVGYLPQTLPLEVDRTVADVLGVAPVIAALDALAAGDASEAVFAAIGDDWDLEDRLRAQLDRLGLCQLEMDRPLRSLSGGEAVSVGLVAQLLRRPEVLLLDEPTYGGTFTDYENAVDAAQRSAESDIRNAEQLLSARSDRCKRPVNGRRGGRSLPRAT
jgi:ATPase subunit of ABC transporter with duplicated ATPase domains